MNIAIIPARGGSKRIPQKNIKLFFGKPLIAYSIETAMSSGIFDKVIVSTDCPQIKEIALNYGATVPFLRSPENSSDFASTADVIEEVLLDFRNKLNREVKSFCCIYPTSPLLKEESLRESQQKFISSDSSSLISICKFSNPIQRALEVSEGKVKFCSPQYTFTRSQDLPPRYFDAGQFYWGRAIEFLKKPTMVTLDAVGFELYEMEVQDIDNPMDWEIAELKYMKNSKSL